LLGLDAPVTLDEFYRAFPTERNRCETLRRPRWPDRFRCPRCAGREAHPLRSCGLWPFAGCRCQASPTAGTSFHTTRVPLRTGFLAMSYSLIESARLAAVGPRAVLGQAARRAIGDPGAIALAPDLK
jgi:hypothetical protein